LRRRFSELLSLGSSVPHRGHVAVQHRWTWDSFDAGLAPGLLVVLVVPVALVVLVVPVVLVSAGGVSGAGGAGGAGGAWLRLWTQFQLRY